MLKILFKKNATSVLEYTVLVTIIMAAFILMNRYIFRGLAGNWKEIGDSFGFGRQFDTKVTEECGYLPRAGKWYLSPCFEPCVNDAAAYRSRYNVCMAGCTKKLQRDRFGSCQFAPKTACHSCCETMSKLALEDQCLSLCPGQRCGIQEK